MMADKKVAKTSAKEVEEKKAAPVKKTSKKALPGKIKPELDEKTQKLLEIRKERYEKQPTFRRGEWFRYKRIGTNWRRPRAVTNKMRLNRKYRPPKVRIGYGKPDGVRNIHPSGFREVMVFNTADLESINPKVQAARIGSTVGTRKRKDIVQAADQKGIRILNRGVL
jgi:large subunit ribosomal protein L32e